METIFYSNYTYKASIWSFSFIVLIHLISCFYHNEGIKKMTKIFLMPLLLLIYFQITSKKSRSLCIIIGLILGTTGDIFLIFSFIKILLVLGLVSFLFGHFFYISEIISRIKLSIWRKRKFLALVLFSFFGIFFSYIYKYYFGEGVKKHKFEIPGIAYLSTLCILDSVSLFYLINNASLNSLIVYFGAISFSLSDLILGRDLFYNSNNEYFSFFIMLTYINAQVLITLGLAKKENQNRIFTKLLNL